MRRATVVIWWIGSAIWGCAMPGLADLPPLPTIECIHYEGPPKSSICKATVGDFTVIFPVNTPKQLDLTVEKPTRVSMNGKVESVWTLSKGKFSGVFLPTTRQTLDLSDLENMVVDRKLIRPGDADLNGLFNSTDLVQVFSAGEYEDRIAKNSTWPTGDWNGDAEFNTSDLIVAFGRGGYESQVAAQAVPEPLSVMLLGWGLVTLLAFRRRM